MISIKILVLEEEGKSTPHLANLPHAVILVGQFQFSLSDEAVLVLVDGVKSFLAENWQIHEVADFDLPALCCRQLGSYFSHLQCLPPLS